MTSLPLPSGGYINNIYHISDIHIRAGDRKTSRYDEYDAVFTNLYNELSKSIDEYSAIIITGDLFHNKSRIDNYGTLLFNKLIGTLSSLCPIYIIQGNHDYQQYLLKTEPDLIEASLSYNKNDKVYYLKETGIYLANNICFGLVSIKDALKEGDTFGKCEKLPEYPKIDNLPKTVKTKIALFHGMVYKNEYDIYNKKNCGYPLEWFKGYDIVMLGDIHLQQINDAKLININNYIFDNNKQVWGYAGSLIQQNYGENLFNHGYLNWNIKSNLVSCHHIYNDIGYLKVKDTFELEKYLKNPNCPKRLYLRINYDLDISEYETLLNTYNILYHIIYNHDIIEHNKIVSDNNETITETNNINTLIEYIKSNITYDNTNGDNTNDDNTNCENNEITRTNIELLWKNWINNPKKLLFENNIDTLTDVIDTRNKNLTKLIENYETYNDNHINSKKTLFLDYIEWGWLLCFENRCWFDFNNINNNIAVINSQNGYGKSSFLEVICLAIFGESIPSRYSRDYSSSIICQKMPSNEKAYTDITIKINDKRYTICRKFDFKHDDKNKIHNYITHLYEITDNGIVNINSGKTAVQLWINNNIGSLDNFLLSTMISQNTDNDFFSMKSVEQNNIIDNALNLDFVNHLNNIFKETIKSCKFIKTNALSVFKHINKDKETVYDINKLNILQKQIDDNNTLISKYNKKLLKLQKQIEGKLYNENDINMDIIELQKIYDDINSNLKPLNKDDINVLYEKKGFIFSKIINDNVEAENISDNIINKLQNKYDMYLKNYNEFLLTKPIYNLEELNKISYTIKKINNIYGSYDDINKLKETLFTNKPSISLDEIKNFFIKNNININELNNIPLYDDKYYNKKIENINNKLNTIQDDIYLYNKYNELYLDNLKNNVKEPNINVNKIEEFNKKFKIQQKNKPIIEKRLKAYKNIISLNELIKELNKSLKKYKNNAYNDECWACKKQVWRIEYDNILLKLNDYNEEYDKEINKYNLELDDIKSAIIKDEEKLKEISNNELLNIKYTECSIEWDNYNKWLNEYNDIKEKYDLYKEIFNKKDTLLNELNELYLNKNINDMIKLYNEWSKYNNYLEIVDILTTIPDTYNINNIKNDFNWYNNKEIYDKELNKLKTELDNTISKKYLWLYNEITDEINNINLNDKLKYWENILNIKPIIDNINALNNNISTITKENDKLSSEYHKYKTLYDEYNNKNKQRELYKNFINDIDIKEGILDKIISSLLNYRSWLYKTKVIPKILNYTNSIISTISLNNLNLSADVNKDCIIQWYFKDGTNRPIIEKASGFQKFILGLSIRIALANLAGIKCNQLFIDEGFVACDTEHLSRVPSFLINLLNIYNSVIVVSHLDCIKEINSKQITINRNNDLSLIQFGNNKIIEKKKRGRNGSGY
jgi:DNA repair exonuclease SbcCD ATPase subunit